MSAAHSQVLLSTEPVTPATVVACNTHTDQPHSLRACPVCELIGSYCAVHHPTRARYQAAKAAYWRAQRDLLALSPVTATYDAWQSALERRDAAADAVSVARAAYNGRGAL